VTVDDGTGRSSVAILRTPAFSAVVETSGRGAAEDVAERRQHLQ
jgi:hypothetical protein